MKTLEEIRGDFPILNKKVNGRPLVYFDNGATSHKPKSVIHAISDYYKDYNSNIHRGVHQLSQLATEKYETSREVIQKFVNANSSQEIIFTKGTTEAINLVASSWGRKELSKGDQVIISAMEHHSNIVPWQLICEEKGAELMVAPINNNGELILEDLFDLISKKTKIIALTHISNTLGTINPIKRIIDKAHDIGAVVLIDAAQSVPHIQIDVQHLNCDFLAFSGHKMYGPTGIGVLYAKKELLNKMPPYQGGGDMIKDVTFKKTTYNDLPHKFEAGTPNIAGVIALAEAVKYIWGIGYDFILKQESHLLKTATKSLKQLPGLHIIGNAAHKTGVISFKIDRIHPFDIGTLLDQLGIAIRTGHHCTQPLMDFYNIPGTARASFSFYNTEEEIEKLISALKRAIKMLG